MTPASLPDPTTVKEAHAKARAWASLFRLPLRQQNGRGMTGTYSGMGTGSSLDFQDHRAYAPGDDPRHINWQAYARTGNYSMKLFREEVRPVIDLVWDVSPSMWFDPDKATRTAELMAFTVEGALRAGTTPQVWLCQGSTLRPVPPEAAAAGLWPALIPAPDPACPGGLQLNRIPWRARSLRLIVSDLLFPGGPGGSTALLSGQQARGVLLVPFAPSEADPGWDGNIDFEDVESGQRHPRRVEASLLRRYTSAYTRHFALWKEACQRHGVAMARVPSGIPFPQALQLEALPSGAVDPWT
jgi:uncharacterized protein (DUF58 family)